MQCLENDLNNSARKYAIVVVLRRRPGPMMTICTGSAVALLTYKEVVAAFRVTNRLSEADRARLMGETLARVYNWSPSKT